MFWIGNYFPKVVPRFIPAARLSNVNLALPNYYPLRSKLSSDTLTWYYCCSTVRSYGQHWRVYGRFRRRHSVSIEQENRRRRLRALLSTLTGQSVQSLHSRRLQHQISCHPQSPTPKHLLRLQQPRRILYQLPIRQEHRPRHLQRPPSMRFRLAPLSRFLPQT